MISASIDLDWYVLHLSDQMFLFSASYIHFNVEVLNHSEFMLPTSYKGD